MIIECVNCNKKFRVNSDQIPADGRTIQCGSCNHVWFFEKKNQPNIVPTHKKEIENEIYNEKESQNNSENNTNNQKINKLKENLINKSNDNEKALIKYHKKSHFRLSKLLSYILVLILSFIGLIIVLDTFINPLSIYFPNLEMLLFNLFEVLKDIFLFIKDLK